MMRLHDNLALALTKLRTRRIRLIITLTMSGLLFTVLVAASLIVRGALGSLQSFTQEQFYNRFIDAVNLPTDGLSYFSALNDTKYIERAKTIFAQQLTRMTAEAKRLGISFDPTQQPKPYTQASKDAAAQLDLSQPAARQAVAELGPPANQSAKIREIGAPYHITNLYTQTSLSGNGSVNTGQTFSLTPVIKHQEVADETTSSATSTSLPNSLKNFTQSTLVQSNELLTPFLLPGATANVTAGSTIPIFAPVDAAEKLVGLPAPGAKATDDQRLSHLAALRNASRNFEFDVCYRNSTAVQQLADAKSQAADIKAHAADKTYTMPSVVYGTASQPCQAVPVTSDTRSADQKAADAKTAAFNQEFTTPAPVIATIKFRIVGLVPQVNAGSGGFDMQSFVAGILVPTITDGWSIPRSALPASPILSAIINDPSRQMVDANAYLIEFPSRTEQRRFNDNQTCGSGDDFNACTKANKLYSYPYGNPIAAIYDSAKQYRNFLYWVLGIIAGLSAVIMMGTIGKVIADSRKETSVFRALGAKRSHIAQIYLMYAAVLGLLSGGIAMLLGLALASWLEISYSHYVSISAVLAFNASDVHKTFHLIGWSWLDMGVIALLIIAASQVAAGLPLLTNIRRNPVKDMREE